MKFKLRTGDIIEVISGPRDIRGKRGEILKVMTKKRRVVVQGLNIRKKHQRQVQQQGRTMAPGIIEFEGPIHISNVMLVCPKCDEASRLGIEHDEDKIPHRVCRSCKEFVN